MPDKNNRSIEAWARIIPEKKPKIDYLTPKGYVVTVQLGGLGHDHDLWVAHTNDPDAYQLINHQWTSQDQAQSWLDVLAKEQGWQVRKNG